MDMGDKEKRFWMYHEANPEFYQWFDKFCKEAVAAGFKKYAAHEIIQRIRWWVKIELKRTDGFKISNDLFPYYARLWMKNNPQQIGFFNLHKLKYPVTERLHVPSVNDHMRAAL